MPFYRTEDGQASMHIHFGNRRNPTPKSCRAPRLETDNPTISDVCCRVSSKLCDAPAGKDLAGHLLTCDMPICAQHATSGGPNIDYCPRHARLGTQSGLPLD